MKQYDLIAFDWDGTLMDSTQQIIDAMQLGIKQLDLPPVSDSAVSHIIGLGLNEAVFTLYPDLDSSTRQTLGRHYQQNWLSNPREAPLFENATQLIKYLHQQDYFLGVATGKSRSGLDKVLHRTALNDFFHATRCVDECHSKPHPDMLEQLMDYLGVTPDKTLMIGDTSHDLNMANNAKADCVAVTHGAHDIETLQSCEPKFIAKNLHQVQQWLTQ
ncbi:MAG: HAD-IA family hydrolase [Gammaproteobacteria bacterium]|jgi:phosphoglycolate phosphatase|nr:HAD-IA family hydrolase [Gammaproteobacteria bacterium]